MIGSLQPGDLVTIHYPRRCLVSSAPEFRRRSFVYHRRRDLLTNPLTIDEFLRRPFVRRSRWLVIGQDAETNRPRQFYLGATKEYWHPAALRVGLYEPAIADGYPIEVMPVAFLWTPSDRIKLAHLLLDWRHVSFGGLRLGIFANDLDVVSDETDLVRNVA